MLDRTQRAIILFEDTHPQHDAAKVRGIRELFAIEPSQYYSVLGQVLTLRTATGPDRRAIERIRERITTSLDQRVRNPGG